MQEHSKIKSKPSICFVSPDNLAALLDDPSYGHIGGAERQQVLLGKGLVKRGYQVTFVTLDHGQEDDLQIDGIRVVKAYAQHRGIPVLRFLHPRLTALWCAMKLADADIYYQRTRDSTTGVVAAFCRRHRRKFVYAVASNYHCMTDPQYCPSRHMRLLYAYGIRRAHHIIAQTRTQQRLLRENFGVESTVIPNCGPDRVCGSDASGAEARLAGRRLLWIGTFDPIKRLELLLDIAEQLRDCHCDVVGDGDRSMPYVQCLLARARRTATVHLYGEIPHTEVRRLYKQAAVLICTSRSEGFPNTFLEAWGCGVPTVSTFDPDNLIAQRGLGKVGTDVSELVAGTRAFIDSLSRWKEASQIAREYYMANHTVDSVMIQIERVFEHVLGMPSTGGEAICDCPDIDTKCK